MTSKFAFSAALLGLLAPAVAQGTDECVNATAISGNGFFPFSNLGATNSGVTGLVCSGSSGPLNDGMADDVWFVWTAPANGTFRISTCGLSPQLDSKLAVYDGSNCATSMVVDCDDDTGGCANFSSIVFLQGAVSGSSYLIELGAWGGENGGLGPWTQGTGMIEISQMNPPTPPPNDDCANATQISGLGTFPWDTFNASNDGLPDPLCMATNSSSVNNDVWFLWTAPATGQFQFDMCNLTSLDTKMAAYDNQPCPPNGALVCDDDDGCGTVAAPSRITISAVQASSYFIQIGAWSVSGEGSGDMIVTMTGGPTNIGTNYCSALPNSSGGLASISAAGSESVVDQALALSASSMPQGVNGIFYYGTNNITVPGFGDGFRCVGGALQRLPFNSANASGVMTEPDVFSQPMPNLAILPGTLNFQGWYRDPSGPGGTGFNTTDGISITFVP